MRAFPIVACLIAAGCLTGDPDPSTPAPAGFQSCAGLELADPVVLYVTESAGYEHSVLPHSVEILSAVGSQRGFHVEPIADASTAVDGLEGCAGLVFYTSGELDLSGPQKQRLLQFVSEGGAFVGFHSATDTFYEWGEYGHLIGAYFQKHPWRQEVTVSARPPRHEVLGALPNSFQVTDEIYVFDTFYENEVRVVLDLDTNSVDMSGQTPPAWGYPLAWVRDYGQGRVFYTALGHGGIWDDPQYQELVGAGTQWALREN